MINFFVSLFDSWNKSSQAAAYVRQGRIGLAKEVMFK